jgi:hypothetical protein
LSRSLIGKSRSAANTFDTPRYASLSSTTDHHAGAIVIPARAPAQPSAPDITEITTTPVPTRVDEVIGGSSKLSGAEVSAGSAGGDAACA